MTTIALAARDLTGRLPAMDKVWLAFAAVLLALFVVLPTQGVESARFVAVSLAEILPYLAASIVIASAARASGADGLIAAAFQGRASLMIITAALFGALSPFCSCGVIPLIAALLAMGVPLAPVMAFWLASPIMDPSMFVLTTAVLGTEFAVAKTFAAISLGLAGGFGTQALLAVGAFGNPLREGVGDGGCGGATIRSPKPIVWRFWEEEARRNTFRRDSLKNTLFLGKWLAMAFLLESLMLAWLPADLVVQSVGGSGWIPIGLATAVGVPAYLNGYAALPLVGGLMEQGMAPGAALAFLVAGGVTSIPAAIAVFALARKPVFLAYIGFSLAGAFTAGILFQLWTLA